MIQTLRFSGTCQWFADSRKLVTSQKGKQISRKVLNLQPKPSLLIWKIPSHGVSHISNLLMLKATFMKSQAYRLFFRCPWKCPSHKLLYKRRKYWGVDKSTKSILIVWKLHDWCKSWSFLQQSNNSRIFGEIQRSNQRLQSCSSNWSCPLSWRQSW